MKKTLLAALLVSSAALAGTLQVPTALEVIPDSIFPVGNCKAVNSGKVTVAVTGSDAAGNPTGYAQLIGFTCFPVRVSGRGFGVRTVDGCANVTWDASGEIVAIENTLVRFQPPVGYVPDCA